MTVNLSIKNAPDEMVARLKSRAARNHRSLQGELMAILQVSVAEYPVLEADQANRLIEKIRSINLPSKSEAGRMVREDRDGGHTEGR